MLLLVAPLEILSNREDTHITKIRGVFFWRRRYNGNTHDDSWFTLLAAALCRGAAVAVSHGRKIDCIGRMRGLVVDQIYLSYLRYDIRYRLFLFLHRKPTERTQKEETIISRRF